tara:strand:- start:9822 stop:10643 length:822 start_codon:yes stop_codon:yes gene_type:complete
MENAAQVEPVENEAEEAVSESNDYGVTYDSDEEIVEDPAEDEAEEEADDANVESAPTEGDVDEPEEPDAVQKRINKITAEKYEERRKAEKLQRELEELRANKSGTNQPTQGEPKLADFDYNDEEYQSALFDYKLDQREIARKEGEIKANETARIDKINETFNANLAVFSETAKDYQDVVKDLPELPNETLSAVMQMDNGPQIAYYLGKHLDVADTVANLSPIMAAIELGKISTRLAGVTAPQKKQSAAPSPVDRINSGGSLSSGGGAKGARYE